MIQHPSPRFCGIVGSICFISGAILTAMEEFTSCLTIVLPIASIQPEQIQPWISAINTALLTIGTTFIVLRQRYLKVESAKQFEKLMEEQKNIKDETLRQHEQVIDGQDVIRIANDRQYQQLLQDNKNLKSHILALNGRIHTLTMSGCDVQGCGLRVTPKAEIPAGPLHSQDQGRSTHDTDQHAPTPQM